MERRELDYPKLPPEWSRWQIVEELGEGTFGTVYRAEFSDQTNCYVSAIKVITIDEETLDRELLITDSSSVEKRSEYLEKIVNGYEKEIQLMYELQKASNIVSIQDHKVVQVEQDRWQIFIRMEYLHPFREYQMRTKLSQEEIVSIGIAVCGALKECEKQGIHHLDITPDNIFLTEDQTVKLGLFGISSRLNLGTDPKSKVRGTISYMAPELYRNESYDHRADLYSLGLFLYKLTNQNMDPFVSRLNGVVSSRVRREAILRRLNGEVLPPPSDAQKELQEIILKACAFDPDDRYESAASMEQELLKYRNPKKEQDEPVSEKEEQTIAGQKDKGRNIVLFAVCIVLIVLLLIAGKIW